ncbi:hypothetical protein DMN91_002330 [Ooceraea biroi]|uniref:Uncharacterized protein n=1 Tax=Ooceraea biroi TaxID=2015173 RepID=A0A3L8E0C5_OOCBI|nr:hypothetical protein DMN91_002330 [Ooceraea biroi]
MMEPPLTSKVLRAPNLKRGQENIRIQERAVVIANQHFIFMTLGHLRRLVSEMTAGIRNNLKQKSRLTNGNWQGFNYKFSVLLGGLWGMGKFRRDDPSMRAG